jgi:hypothetical protein
MRMPAGGPGAHATRDLGRVLLALVVVSVGVLYLLEAADVLDAGAAIADWWPLLLIGVGVVQVLERSHGVTEPLVWVVAGATLLAFTTDVLGDDAWAWVWPAFLVLAGGWILLRRAGTGAHGAPNAASDDTLVASGILGGHKVTGTSRTFAGASLTAVMGGVDLDLRQARLAPEGAVVTATAVLGGIDILVPRDWRVAVNGTPILGGIEDAREPQEAVPGDAPVLRIDAMAVLGGIEVRNEPKA